MPHDRFFVSQIGDPLTQEEARHLKVMRKRVHDHVELIDGQGNLAIAEIVETGFKILSLTKFPKPFLKVHLMIALPHPTHLDWVVEKVTELGVDSITLFPGKLSDSKTIKLERLERLATAATKQCGRLYLPKIDLKSPLPKWPKTQGFFGSMDTQDPHILDVIEKTAENITFFIGPERGFDRSEIDLLKAWGCIGTRLNINTLRAETAAVAASTLLLTRNTVTN